MMVSAHFLRGGAIGIMLMFLSAPLLLLLKRNWVVKVVSILLFLSSLIWMSTILDIWMMRQERGEPATRMLIILSSVVLFTAGSALVFKTKKMKERYAANKDAALPGVMAFLLTFITLMYFTINVEPPVLLFERFMLGGGCFEAFWLAVYAGFLADFMQNRLVSQYLRPKIWLFFSSVFFLQLILGIFGFKNFIMYDTLRLPVPAMMIAEPIFSNTGIAMLILLGVTILLTGPAWCSFLCYFGAFDHYASCWQKEPGTMPKWRLAIQAGIFAIVIITAYALRYFSVLPMYAAILAGAFGVVGAKLIFFWSRKAGVMSHCTAFCPIGLVTTYLGKLNPFRIKINDECDSCGDCIKMCRYGALYKQDVARRKPGITCTLCGDCVAACEKESIDFKFPLLKPQTARTLFIVLVVSLHAIIFGLVRM